MTILRGGVIQYIENQYITYTTLYTTFIIYTQQGVCHGVPLPTPPKKNDTFIRIQHLLFT